MEVDCRDDSQERLNVPIYDWTCPHCGEFEAFYKMADKPKTAPCPDCDAESPQKPCIGLIKGEEAGWLQDTLQVVNKDGGAHCQRFLKDPTRSNYEGWMKGEGLRPLEDGEKARKPTAKQQQADRKQRVDAVMKERQKERSITVK